MNRKAKRYTRGGCGYVDYGTEGSGTGGKEAAGHSGKGAAKHSGDTEFCRKYVEPFYGLSLTLVYTADWKRREF
jgi:hypothetical protein